MPSRFDDPEHDADRLLQRAWPISGWGDFLLPIDPVRIARASGIDVAEATLGQNVSAALVKDPGKDPVILLNAADAWNRKRFSCAHELGHYVRRVDGQYDAYQYFDRRDLLSSSGMDESEIYANNFAAALLMPAKEVRKRYKKDKSVAELALEFDISQEAMQYRLVNLGIVRG